MRFLLGRIVANALAKAMESACRFPVGAVAAEGVLGSATTHAHGGTTVPASLLAIWRIRARSCELPAPEVRAAAPSRTNPAGGAPPPRRAARAARAPPGDRRAHLGQGCRAGHRQRAEHRDPQDSPCPAGRPGARAIRRDGPGQGVSIHRCRHVDGPARGRKAARRLVARSPAPRRPTASIASPDAQIPEQLVERTPAVTTALEGERKHVTVLFAHLEGVTGLLADRDPEEARTLLDPVLESHDGGRPPLRGHREPGDGRRHHGPLRCPARPRGSRRSGVLRGAADAGAADAARGGRPPARGRPHPRPRRPRLRRGGRPRHRLGPASALHGGRSDGPPRGAHGAARCPGIGRWPPPTRCGSPRVRARQAARVTRRERCRPAGGRLRGDGEGRGALAAPGGRRARLLPVRGPRRRARAAPPRVGAGPAGPGAGGGHRRRARRGQVAPRPRADALRSRRRAGSCWKHARCRTARPPATCP